MAGILCRYYAIGNCRYGDQCRYSHDMSRRSAIPPEVCWFNLNGTCTRGENCRFAHIDQNDLEYLISIRNERNNQMATKIENSQTAAANVISVPNDDEEASFHSLRFSNLNSETNAQFHSAASSSSNLSSDSSSVKNDFSAVSDRFSSRYDENPAVESEFTGFVFPDNYSIEPLIPEISDRDVERLTLHQPSESDGSDCKTAISEMPNDLVRNSIPNLTILCPDYEKNGFCANKDCAFINGERCGICGNYSLHPFDQKQRENHQLDCLADQEVKVANMEACSIDKMCGICMEIVWKKEGKERRFGLLENCNHVFCLDCIRKWRASSQYEASVAKGCPECRVKSDYITPSRVWFETPEQKAEIIEAYKQNLSKIHCKYFKNGQGNCPFGNKCFYLHVYEDGTKAVLGSPVASRRRRQFSFGADSASELFFINVLDSHDPFFDITMADLDFADELDSNSISSSNTNLSDYLNEEYIFDLVEGDTSSLSNSFDSVEIFNSPS